MARAVVSAGANYIDLADGRDFEAGISELDESARERGVFVTSGASSLPALSSAVVDKYLHGFHRLDSIRHGIASGARSGGDPRCIRILRRVIAAVSRLAIARAVPHPSGALFFVFIQPVE